MRWELEDLQKAVSPEVWDTIKALNPHIFAPSSSGRTSGFEPGNAGSSPAGATSESEADFQKRLIKELQADGWLVCEFRKARRQVKGKDAYRTPFGANGVGFFDLVAAKPPVVMFIECKSQKGKLSPEQVRWHVVMSQCSQVSVKILRPGESV